MPDSLGLVEIHGIEFSTANTNHQALLNLAVYSIAAMPGDRDIDIEAQNLTALFNKKVKNKAAFAREFKVPGGASMISQHLSGHRPMNIAAAAAYSRGLGIPIAEFSPRLAALVSAAQSSSPATAEGAEADSIDENATLLTALNDWRMQASAKSQQVIDLLCVLAQNNALREEDWALIEQMATRLKPPRK